MNIDVEPDLIALILAAVAILVVALGAVRRTPRGSTLRRLAVCVLLAVTALGPRLGADEDPDTSADADVVVIVDRTTSMGALDNGGHPRMDGVRDDLTALARAMPGSRFSLVLMDNQAEVAMPFTTDTNAVVALAQTIGWRENANATGSDISVGEPVARTLLERSRSQRPRARRYLVYMGDGEQTSSTAPRSFAGLAPLVTGAKVLGYGTTTGAPMPVAPGSTQMVERGGVRQVSRADPEALRLIASQVHGQYVNRSAAGALSWWQPAAASRTGDGARSTTHVGWIGAAAAALIAAWDGAVCIIAWRRCRLDGRLEEDS